MKFTRDTLRTLLALILIIIIVVATFAYGNAQRNKQKADTKVKVTETQTKTSDNEKSATVSDGSTPNNAASTTTSAPAGSSPVVSVTPDTGGSALPETGAETTVALPLLAIATAGYFYIRSRQKLAFSRSNI